MVIHQCKKFENVSIKRNELLSRFHQIRTLVKDGGYCIVVRTFCFACIYIYMYIFIGKFRNFPEFLKLIPNRSTWNIVFGVLFGGGGGKRKGITFVGRGERNVRETCNFAPITPTMLYINIEWKGVTCTACTYPSIVSLCAEIDGGRLFANLHPRANRYVRLCAPLFARDNARIKNSLFGNGASTPRRIGYPMDIK